MRSFIRFKSIVEQYLQFSNEFTARSIFLLSLKKEVIILSVFWNSKDNAVLTIEDESIFGRIFGISYASKTSKFISFCFL
jgi:hypothetical protein